MRIWPESPVKQFAIRAAGLFLAAGLAVANVTACSGQGHGDAQIGDENHGPATTLDFPDGFRNVAAKCDGPNRVYSVSAGSSDTLSGGVAVVPNDPRCKTP